MTNRPSRVQSGQSGNPPTSPPFAVGVGDVRFVGIGV